jgi:hypothetical protein
LVLSDEIGRRLDVGIRERASVAPEGGKLADDAVDLLQAGSVSIDEQIVTLRADPDIEKRLEVLQVLVVGAKQRLDAFFGNSDAFDCVYLLIIQRLTGAL